MNCIFCKIVQDDLPAMKVYEDEFVLAFLDINPYSRGHTLVIPKAHHKNARDLPAMLWEPIMRVVAQVGEAAMQHLEAKGFTVVMSNEQAGEQVVFHAHVHVIPRYDKDGLRFAQPHQKRDDAERVATLLRLK